MEDVRSNDSNGLCAPDERSDTMVERKIEKSEG
jgi:hypothetical protein